MPGLPCREILEMRSVGLSERKVASLCGCGVKKVSEAIGSARRLGIGWPVPAKFSDDELEQLVDPLKPWRRHRPDFPEIREILSGRLKEEDLDAAYDSYAAESELVFTKPYVKVTFKRTLLNWLGSSDEGVSMRINWAAGEEVRVDWAGRTLGIVDADGRTAFAFLLVTTVPYSGYTFIRASLHGHADLARASLQHVRVLRRRSHLARVGQSGVDRLLQEGRREGRQPQVPGPGRPLRGHGRANEVATPTDKGAVEGHVSIMANRAMKTLEGLSFSSITQLNRAISELLALYNSKPSPALAA